MNISHLDNKDGDEWACEACGARLYGVGQVQDHMAGRKHKTRLAGRRGSIIL